MVFFNCNACGEALKKNQVEKHYQTRCRNCEVLSCVDCGKDFWGNDYQQHTKCISEEEKYSGKDYKPKPGANKGEAKQEAWTEQVQQAIDKAPAGNPKVRSLLESLKDYPNIPRKKAKFENFLKNSLRVYDSQLAAKAWDLISAEMTKQTGTPSNAGNQTVKTNQPELSKTDNQSTENRNGESNKTENETVKKINKRERKEERRNKTSKQEKKDKRKQESSQDEEENQKKKKKHKKRKHCESESDETEVACAEDDETPKKKKRKTDKENKDENVGGDMEDDLTEAASTTPHEDVESHPAGKFKWEATIISVLKTKDDKELSVKRLRKKVLAEYMARAGDHNAKSEEKLMAKFNKKINHNPRLKVFKDKVKLVR